MGELRVADKVAGDLKVIWNPENSDEVKAAEEQFNKLIKKNFIAFKVGKGGEKGKKITEFDADLEMIIMAPMLKGG
jgi:hypothetical protein